MEDIQKAFMTIDAKRSALDDLFSYVNGPQPLKYSTERLRDAFDNITAHFEINWCTVVVDAVLDRIELNGFDTLDQNLNDRLDELFDTLHLDIEAINAHKAALSTSSAYVILWKNGEDIDFYYNDPRLVHVFYDPARPKIKKFAAKWFVLDDGRNEITLYYPNKIEHWQTLNKKNNVTNFKAFVLGEIDQNPYGMIPVFEFKAESEIVKITSLQDAVNKIFADMMVAAEFGAFIQRWVISQADPGDLQNGPNKIWWIPSGDTEGQGSSVGQFSPTQLNQYLDSMDKLANAIAIITRTPKHYFMNTGANISGEALLAMESPLVKKVETKQTIFSSTWQDIASFLLLIDGGIKIEPNEISVTWERPESIQPLTEAQTLQTYINAGIPLTTQLKRDGWTEQEIESLLKDKKEEQKASRALGQQVLDSLRTEQDQSNEVSDQEKDVSNETANSK